MPPTFLSESIRGWVALSSCLMTLSANAAENATVRLGGPSYSRVPRCVHHPTNTGCRSSPLGIRRASHMDDGRHSVDANPGAQRLSRRQIMGITAAMVAGLLT